MSTSAPVAPSPEPTSALSSLAATLDASHSDIPSFLNNLLSPLLPPDLPPPNPVQPSDLAPIDKSLNELLTQLSLLSQDTNSAVEQSIHDVSRTVPRLAYDLQFMRESANGLQSSLGMVQDRVARQTDLSSPINGSKTQGENDGMRTNKSLEKLTHLDKLKNRLESARDILREAESWSTLESELTTFITNAEYVKAGHRLHEASKSMIVFQNTPAEYEDRKQLLVSLQNQLETSVSKALVESLQQADTESCARFWEVFLDMDREEEFRGYYFKVKSSKLLEDWREARVTEILPAARATPLMENPEDLHQETINFSTLIPKFYTSLLTILNTEVHQIPLIFPPHTAASILATFVQTIFDSLDPSFTARLSAVADFHGPEALPELIRTYRATEELGVAFQGLIDRMVFNTQGGLLSGAVATSPAPTLGGQASSGHQGPSPTAMTRTPSKKMSISRRFSRAPTLPGPQPVDNSWETTLYEPFLDLQSTYATLERRYLEHIIRNDQSFQTRLSTGKDISRVLLDRVNILFSKADEAMSRCVSFTHGYGSLGLLSSLEAGISTFLSAQQDLVLEQIRYGSESNRGRAKERDELDFEGLDYSTEDWGSFQLGLHVLEACREISYRLSTFEHRLEDSLRNVGKILKSTAGEGYDTKSTTFGSISLLQQSTLNSVDLHSLVSSPDYPLLPISLNALASFTKTSQLHLQSIILSPLLNQLETYPHLQVWTKPDKAPKKGELHVPTFSLSPTDVISRVSEGLLDLLRVFEVWSKETGLGWSLGTLPFIEIPPESSNVSSETVLSTWISSLALTLLSHLTSTTLPSIRTLTSGGQAQLKTDLGYLGNAVGALDVHWEDISRWERAVGLDEAGWRKEMRDLRGTEGDGKDGEKEREVVRSVGRMRGWI
ncbi:uncharacterized protein IL334_002211 [Kwoniella shivajii]|uniref:Conserved oligomeric Golgi complex subunit 7 n=1 Tax=Kwoniella shivajii TaxID=564305 RepID=A0ABZ1CU80_9TREE|nr:hypothetical protein IL334_002211 [Kwoniella shivajii]